MRYVDFNNSSTFSTVECRRDMNTSLLVWQGKSQRLEANVARVSDATSKKVKNLQLKHPVRIRVNKSPVLINYRLYQVGVCSLHFH